MTEVVVTTGAIRRAKLHLVTTNKRTPSFFTGRMSFLSPNQQCQSTERAINEKIFSKSVHKFWNYLVRRQTGRQIDRQIGRQ